MKSPTYRMKSRMIVVLTAMILFGFSVIVLSLFRLQILEGPDLQSRALRQQLQTTRIGAKRGTIYDTNGKALAKSATVYTVCVAPGQIVNKDPEVTKKNRDEIADMLNNILGLDKESIYKTLDKTSSLYEVVKTKVEKPQADAILKEINEKKISGVFFEEATRRYYPYGNFAATVLGFTNYDNVGAYGLESYYEKTLAGAPGRVVSLRNRRGVNMPMQYEQTDPAKDGNSLVLTIDENIQHYLEKNLETALEEHHVQNYVAGIVMDVKTGAILAMSTKPDFDPNDPYAIFDEDVKKELDELKTVESKEAYQKAFNAAQFKQWRNKTISDPYEPGSVFKIVTTATGLESGAITEQSTFYCAGYVEVAGHIQRCWVWSSRNQGHGQQQLVDAVKNSCNPAFIDIGQRIGAPKFAEYFENFGLTKGTDIDLPGEANSIYHASLSLSDLSSSAFGQTFKVTPIQLITACSAAVNGGKLMQPYVVKQVIDSDGNVVSTTEPVVKRQVISEDISKEVTLLLEQVVGGGGSGKQAAIPGYRIGGKTGTSEKLDHDADGRPNNTLSFFGFAPVDDPQVACLVLIDEPNIYNAYGSTIAAPIVGSILADVLPYMGIEPQYSEEELENVATATPYLINYDIHEAEWMLRKDGIKFRVIGSGPKVLRQIPGAQEPIPPDGTVVVYTEEVAEEGMVFVPDVLGKSAEEANKLIVGAGLNFSAEGAQIDGAQLTAVSQKPEAGIQVELGTMVTVTFTDPNLGG